MKVSEETSNFADYGSLTYLMLLLSSLESTRFILEVSCIQVPFSRAHSWQLRPSFSHKRLLHSFQLFSGEVGPSLYHSFLISCGKFSPFFLKLSHLTEWREEETVEFCVNPPVIFITTITNFPIVPLQYSSPPLSVLLLI